MPRSAILGLVSVLLAGVLRAQSPAAEASDGGKIHFDRQIRPLLADTCFICHGPDKEKRDSDLRLDTKEGAFADLGGHKALVPGDLAKSELYQRITSSDPDTRMPPPDSGRQLKPEQIELIKKWIEQGASWEQHWSFVPVKRPPLPTVKQSAWPRNGLDSFILQRLEREGLTPAPEAKRETLLRRVTLDLTGLPPTLAEIDAFLADPSPLAYERVVERLLSSPRYGERMVVEWLEAARYADTNGYQGDRTRTMWPWRDWAIAAFNRNQPFDQFTLEQFAGDLLPGATLTQKVATGFHRNHMLNGEGGRIAEESRIDYVIDRVDTTASTWLGLTLGCARCHDHKYDPFSQQDYYRLFAYFNNLPESGGVDREGSANPVIAVPSAEQQARVDALQRELDALKAQLDATPNEQADARSTLEKKIKEIAAQRESTQKSFPLVMILEERAQPRESHVLLRGVWDKPGEKVTATVPAQLAALPADAPSNRLGLAKWLVDPAHPLTARVAVNRQWQQFFGTGLVKTSEDFGAQGERPTHPELLDWLASEFVASGWDVKALQRMIVTSATYRQSSQASAALLERDPANRWLARGPRYRWPSGTIRDQALFAGGLFVEQLGGPPVKPYQPAGVWEEMSFGGIRYEQDHGASLYRRSLYTFWRRATAPTILFDTPSRQVCNVKPSRTNTPLHALTTLNDVTYVEAARGLAERAQSSATTPEDRLTWMYRTVLSRRPNSQELTLLGASLTRWQAHFAADKDAAAKLIAVGESPPRKDLAAHETAAYATVALTILNLDEALSKE